MVALNSEKPENRRKSSFRSAVFKIRGKNLNLARNLNKVIPILDDLYTSITLFNCYWFNIIYECLLMFFLITRQHAKQ